MAHNFVNATNASQWVNDFFIGFFEVSELPDDFVQQPKPFYLTVHKEYSSSFWVFLFKHKHLQNYQHWDLALQRHLCSFDTKFLTNPFYKITIKVSNIKLMRGYVEIRGHQCYKMHTGMLKGIHITSKQRQPLYWTLQITNH